MKKLLAAAVVLTLLSPAFAADVAVDVSRAGTRTVTTAPAQHFTGSVKVEMLHTPSGTQRASAGSVSFSPGARTAWHSHPLGQTLVVTAGVGRVQRWGGPAEEIRTGDVIRIAPGVKHWHGAARGSAMTHIAITEALDGKTADWQELVTDAQVGDAKPAGAPPTGSHAEVQPTRAQALLGDVAPKLAQLTDDAVRRRVGASWVVAARPQPRNCQRVDRAEPARSVALALGASAGQRAVEGRDLRGADPSRVLCRLAQRHRRRRRGA